MWLLIIKPLGLDVFLQGRSGDFTSPALVSDLIPVQRAYGGNFSPHTVIITTVFKWTSRFPCNLNPILSYFKLISDFFPCVELLVLKIYFQLSVKFDLFDWVIMVYLGTNMTTEKLKPPGKLMKWAVEMSALFWAQVLVLILFTFWQLAPLQLFWISY